MYIVDCMNKFSLSGKSQHEIKCIGQRTGAFQKHASAFFLFLPQIANCIYLGTTLNQAMAKVGPSDMMYYEC